MAQWLSDRLGQPVVVENRPGASSKLATEAAVRAPADGYTLVLGGAVNAINATLFEKLNFNFIGDLVPVAGLVRFPNVMTVRRVFFPQKRFPSSSPMRKQTLATSTTGLSAEEPRNISPLNCSR
jgi:tripartite-type tricarboxylate transporter receptor subunit TctC